MGDLVFDLLAALKHRFTHHVPCDEKVASHEEVRALLHSASIDIASLCPDGRELYIALEKLEEAMFWANAAIARGAEK